MILLPFRPSDISTRTFSPSDNSTHKHFDPVTFYSYRLYQQMDRSVLRSQNGSNVRWRRFFQHGSLLVDCLAKTDFCGGWIVIRTKGAGWTFSWTTRRWANRQGLSMALTSKKVNFFLLATLSFLPVSLNATFYFQAKQNYIHYTLSSHPVPCTKLYLQNFLPQLLRCT